MCLCQNRSYVVMCFFQKYVLMCFCQKRPYVVMAEIWGYVLGTWDGDLAGFEPRGRGRRYIYGFGEIGLLWRVLRRLYAYGNKLGMLRIDCKLRF